MSERPLFPGIREWRKKFPTGFLLRIQLASPSGGTSESTGPATEEQVKAIMAILFPPTEGTP